MVNGEGPIPCETLILGEAPGADEERQGRPFVGASGKLLDRALEAAGVSRSDVYITNAYKLRPPNNRTPTQDELGEHRPYLLREFREVNPQQTLLLGSVALHTIFPEAGGVVWNAGRWGRKRRTYFATVHPSYVLHGGISEEVFFSHVRRFFNEFPEHPTIR